MATCGVDVELICVGSGAAIQLARNGDVDAIVVHSPADERLFMKTGYGKRRETFMYNSFVLLGPENDSVGWSTLSVEAALRKLSAAQALFVSRGDLSGTHQRELSLWESANAKPAAKHYLETGQGMGATLLIANQKNAYTLCDYGTYLKFRDKIKLDVKIKEQESLLNFYSVLVVNPEQTRRRQNNHVDSFVEFLISEDGQKQIESYTIDDENLFFPMDQQKATIKP